MAICLVFVLLTPRLYHPEPGQRRNGCLYITPPRFGRRKSCRETRALARSGQRHVHGPMRDTDHRRLQPHSVVMRAIFLLFSFRPGQAANIYEGSPPVFGAFPTGGPIDGGTSVTIFGREFDQINRFPSEARCSWGDPREWQQAVFAAQQARPRAPVRCTLGVAHAARCRLARGPLDRR